MYPVEGNFVFDLAHRPLMTMSSVPRDAERGTDSEPNTSTKPAVQCSGTPRASLRTVADHARTPRTSDSMQVARVLATLAVPAVCVVSDEHVVPVSVAIHGGTTARARGNIGYLAKYPMFRTFK